MTAVPLGLPEAINVSSRGARPGRRRSGRAGEAVRRPGAVLAHAERAEVPAGMGLTPVEIAGRMSASLTVEAEQPGEPQE
ncbi:hypothetical protein ABZ499_25725 [Streptomyces sp. NPDC019990]|uniref:hypothetical protein n=1 Tax=Streptomyces sp. NPDC019990 TaxID=3154693 RepID=UPI003411389C